MSNINERAAHLMDTAEFDGFIVFDRCAVIAAKLETGEILVEACDCRDPEKFDKNAAASTAMELLSNRVLMMEKAKEHAGTMTEQQARIIVALADSNMVIKEAAEKLNYHASSVSYQIGKIKDETGKDPKKFFDMCQLLVEARSILKEVEA